MDRIDLVDRILPLPAQTIAVETPEGNLVLVDTERPPGPGNTVLVEDSFMAYEPDMNVSGVAYCLIQFI